MGNGWPIAIVWKRLPVRKSPATPVVAKPYDFAKGCQIFPRYRPFAASLPLGEMKKATAAEINAIMGRPYDNDAGDVGGPYLLHWLNSANADRSTYADKAGFAAECYALPASVTIAVDAIDRESPT